jgi:hypothetical protein
MFPTVNRHAERSIVDKAADKGGEDWELRQGPAFRDISDAREGRVMGEWDICIQLSKSLPRLTSCFVPLSLVTKHWVRNSCMGVFEPCGKSNTSQLPYRILKTYLVDGGSPKVDGEIKETRCSTTLHLNAEDWKRMKDLQIHRITFVDSHALSSSSGSACGQTVSSIQLEY